MKSLPSRKDVFSHQGYFHDCEGNHRTDDECQYQLDDANINPA